MTNYEIIQQKLQKFVKKYFINKLIRGFILFVFFSVIYLFITALVEYFLWLPSDGRKYLYYGVFVALIIFFVLFLFRPLLNLLGIQKSLSFEKSSTIIGDFFPEIRDKLLNTLQLKQQSDASDLVLASIDQKAADLKHFKFSNAINFKQNAKYLPLLLLPFLIFLVLKLTHLDKEVGNSYQRVLSYQQDFTPPLPFQLSPISKETVVQGQAHQIQVLVKGTEIPDQIYLIKNRQRILLHRENDSIYTYFIPTVYDNFDYNLEADNHNFGPFSVKMIYPPIIQNIQVDLIYPRYLHKRNDHFNNAGNFTIPEGTTIKWQLKTVHTDSLLFKINEFSSFLKVVDNQSSIKKYVSSDFTYTIAPINQFLKDTEQLSYSVKTIKDQYPQLKVLEKQDSINHQNIYRILASDDNGLHRLQLIYRQEGSANFKTKNIVIPHTDLAQLTYIFPGDISLEDGKAYQYYFKLFDNDVIHKYKSVKSNTFYFNKLTKKQLEEENLSQQKADLDQLQKLNQQFQKQKKQLNKFNKELTQKKALDWQTKKKLDNTIQQAEKQEKFFKEAIKKYKDLLDKMPEKKDDLTKEELKKRLEELAKLDKKKKLLDELKKLADKLKKEDLVEKLKDLEKHSEHQEKSLERILELTKKYYMQQKLQKMSEKLDELSKKQEALAKKDTDTKKQQDSLNNEMKDLQKQSDSLQKMNKELKRPMKLPDNEADMQDIEEDMKQASDKLQKQDAQNANKKQQKAANKMKQLAADMQQAMQGGEGEQNEEDIATLQAILKSLLNFSFQEEGLITNLYKKRGKTHLSKQLLNQNRLKVYYKHISDSLYTLALRNPKISQFVMDQSFEIESSIDKTLDNLAENRYAQVNQHSQYILSGANTLANMLSNVLDAQKNAQPSSGKGKGKKGKGQSFSLPDIIKKQGQSISQMKDALKKKGDKGKKKGEKGKKDGEKPNGKEKGKSGQGGEGEQQAKKQFELYKQQQRIKEDLQQLGDKFSDKASQQKAKELSKQMDELQKRLLKEGITQSVLNKMIQLQHELLKLKNATFTQHEDNKRQSRSNYKKYQYLDSIFYKDNPRFNPQNELLKRSQIPVNQNIKTKIKQYLNTNND